MLVRPMLLHHMSLVSFLLFCKNLGNLQEFFGQMVYRPPGRKLPIRRCFYLVQTLTTKDCIGPQTNMPKNVGSIKN